jgi:hypothetical protein
MATGRLIAPNRGNGPLRTAADADLECSSAEGQARVAKKRTSLKIADFHWRGELLLQKILRNEDEPSISRKRGKGAFDRIYNYRVEKENKMHQDPNNQERVKRGQIPISANLST